MGVAERPSRQLEAAHLDEALDAGVAERAGGRQVEGDEAGGRQAAPGQVVDGAEREAPGDDVARHRAVPVEPPLGLHAAAAGQGDLQARQLDRAVEQGHVGAGLLHALAVEVDAVRPGAGLAARGADGAPQAEVGVAAALELDPVGEQGAQRDVPHLGAGDLERRIGQRAAHVSGPEAGLRVEGEGAEPGAGLEAGEPGHPVRQVQLGAHLLAGEEAQRPDAGAADGAGDGGVGRGAGDTSGERQAAVEGQGGGDERAEDGRQGAGADVQLEVQAAGRGIDVAVGRGPVGTGGDGEATDRDAGGLQADAAARRDLGRHGDRGPPPRAPQAEVQLGLGVHLGREPAALQRHAARNAAAGPGHGLGPAAKRAGDVQPFDGGLQVVLGAEGGEVTGDAGRPVEQA